MACSSGDIARWSDVAALGAALEPLLEGDLTSSLFLTDSFETGQGKIIFRLEDTYDSGTSGCEQVRTVQGQGFTIASNSSVSEAITNGKAVLVIKPDDGASSPCFCCLAFYISSITSGVVTVSSSPSVGANCNVGTFDVLANPCLGSGAGTHAKGILNKPLLDYYYHGALDSRQSDDEDSSGILHVLHSTCEGSDLNTVYSFVWSDDRSCYRLLSVEVPVTGFVGWLIGQNEFSSLWTDFSSAVSTRCVAEFDSVKEAGSTDTYLDKSCPVTVEDILWNLQDAEGDGVGDPGAIVYSGGTIQKPWEELTNGATSLCSSKRPLYCTTISFFEALIQEALDKTVAPDGDSCTCCSCEAHGATNADEPDPDCPSGQFVCEKDLNDIEGAEGCIVDPARRCKVCMDCSDLEDDYNACPLGITCPEGYESGACAFAECDEDCVETGVQGWPYECDEPPPCYKCRPYPNCTCEALGYSSEMPTCSDPEYPHEINITLDPSCEGTGSITCYYCAECGYFCPPGWSNDSCFNPNTGDSECPDPSQTCSSTDPTSSTSPYCPGSQCYICSNGCTCEDMGLGDPEVDCPAGQFPVDAPVTLSEECGGGQITCRSCTECGSGTCPEGWSAGGCDSDPCSEGFSCQETNGQNPPECPETKCHKCAPAFCTCADFGASDTPPATCPAGQQSAEVTFTKIGDCPGGAGTITCYECQTITCPTGSSLGSCGDDPCEAYEQCTQNGANCYSCGPLTCEGYGLLPAGCNGTCVAPDQCQTISTGGAIDGDCAHCVNCTSCGEAGYFATESDCEAAKTNEEDTCQSKSVSQPDTLCDPDELSCYELVPATYGCTWPASQSYNSAATIDDGSCQSCASGGHCVVPDPTPEGGDCSAAADGGCCDEACTQPYLQDCSPTFGSSFTATNGVYYPSCYG